MRLFLKFINNIEELLCGILLAAFVTILFAQIVSRALFSYSLAWSEELSTHMFVWFAYLGASVAAKMSAHNRVSFQFMFFPNRVRIISETVADLLWVSFNLFFVWLSYDFVFNRMNLFWKSQTLGIPMKYFYMILPVAFLLMSLRILWNAYLRISGHEVIDPDQQELENIKSHNVSNGQEKN